MSQQELCPQEDNFEDTNIYAHHLNRFFARMQEQAHHIYALMAGAPKSVFWITREDEDLFPNEKTCSLQEFYAATFGNEDSFRIYFNAYFFPEEWDKYVFGWDAMDNPFNGECKFEVSNIKELTVEEFEPEWLHLLAFLCREAILGNKPFQLDPQTICRHGFTQQDIKLLQQPVELINEKIIAELREQYDRLAAIGCLHER